MLALACGFSFQFLSLVITRLKVATLANSEIIFTFSPNFLWHEHQQRSNKLMLLFHSDEFSMFIIEGEGVVFLVNTHVLTVEAPLRGRTSTMQVRCPPLWEHGTRNWWEVSLWAQHAGSAGVNKGPQSRSLLRPSGVSWDDLYLLMNDVGRKIITVV